ncbi:MAG: sigma-54 dependent transcriptional regulator [Deltaproteobacteria bacterium]|nr:sigma-54 dependent transcriptional regulator [Deltaproteobacteria bacterium]
MNILIIDDEKILAGFITDALRLQKYNVFQAYTAEEGLGILQKENIDIILLDIMLPDKNGLVLLKDIKSMDDSYEVIMITAHSSIKDSITAVKMGAEDYLVKPFELEELEVTIHRVVEKIKLKRELNILRNKDAEIKLNYYIGTSKNIKDAYALAMRVAQAEQTMVLIEGESGTGKELLANFIHRASKRARGPLISINCAAIPDQLLEEEFFGYEPGAFTDAKKRKKGLLELADGGFVFLDEIGELSPMLQAKLLRVIESKSFIRLGGEKEIKSDIRFIVATNKDLKGLVNKGLFRDDLYYRVSVMPIKLPPLRERKEDITILVSEFIKSLGKTMQTNVRGIENDALDLLLRYNWPGNIRELKNVIERAVMLTDTEKIGKEQILLPQSAESNYKQTYMENAARAVLETKEPLYAVINQIENAVILKALERTQWNVTKAAEELGVSRNVINYKFRKKEIPAAPGKKE